MPRNLIVNHYEIFYFIKKWILISILMISFSCSENKTEDNVSLTSPIPTIPSEVKNDTPDGVKNKADENEDPLLDKIPSYIAIEYNIADSINIKEGESKKFILGLNAFNKYNIKLDKDLFLYNLDIRCSSPCPDGISLDDDGNINFSASYDDEGEFEVSVIANIRGFNIENTFGPINVKVFHTNQRPEILDIKLISLDVPINGSLIPHFSCDVIRKDNDNDRLKTFYEWYANNVQLDSSKNIDFNKSVIKKSYFKPGENIYCKATVKEVIDDITKKYGLSSDVKQSNLTKIPNRLPSIDGVVLVVKKASGSDIGRVFRASNDNVEIGDEVGCYTSVADLDGDEVKLNAVDLFYTKNSISGLVSSARLPDKKFKKIGLINLFSASDSTKIAQDLVDSYYKNISDNLSGSDRILNEAFYGHSLPFLQKLTEVDSHKSLKCEVSVADVSEPGKLISATSDTITIKNRPPLIKYIELYNLNNSDIKEFKSGDRVFCESVIEDPDGDLVQQDIVFINEKNGDTAKSMTRNLTLNLSKKISNSDNWIAKEAYDLKPYNGSKDDSIDIKNDSIYCRVDATDSFGGTIHSTSSKFVLKDSQPNIYLIDNGAGAVVNSPLIDNNSYIVGQKISDKFFKIVDNDGDIPNNIKLEKNNDYSVVPSTISNSGSKICEGFPAFSIVQNIKNGSNFFNGGFNYILTPLDNISTIIGSHYSRGCNLSIKPDTSSEKEVSIRIKSPNREPSVLCLNTNQYLDPSIYFNGSSWEVVGDTSSDIICRVKDPDDASLLSTDYNIKFSRNDCDLYISRKSFNSMNQSLDFTLNMDNMKNKECISSISVHDGYISQDGYKIGSLKTNNVEIKFLPTYSFSLFNESIQLDQACRISYKFKSNEDYISDPILNNNFLFTNANINADSYPILFTRNQYANISDAKYTNYYSNKDKDKILSLFGNYNDSRSDFIKPFNPATFTFENGINTDNTDFKKFNMVADLFIDLNDYSTLGQYNESAIEAPNIVIENQKIGISLPIYNGVDFKQAISKANLNITRLSVPSIYGKYKTFPSPSNPKLGWVSGQGKQVSITNSGCEDTNDNRSSQKCKDFNRANISLGIDHACTTTNNGELYCWGSNKNQQIIGIDKDKGGISPDRCKRKYVNSDSSISFVEEDCFTRPTNTQVNSVKDLALGNNFTCILKSDGNVYCSGDNYRGATASSSNFEQVSLSSVNNFFSSDYSRFNLIEKMPKISNIAAGLNHVCALAENGLSLYCWGDDSFGQLGLGGTVNKNSNQIVDYIDSENYKTCDTNNIVSCEYIKRDNNIVLDVCGSKADVNDPDNTFAPCSRSVRKIHNFPPKNDRIIGLFAGGNNTCTILQSRKVVCWGQNSYGNLGSGETSLYRSSPVVSDSTIIKLPYDVYSLSVGNDLICAVTGSKKGYCWGNGKSVGLFLSSEKFIPPCSNNQNDYYYYPFSSGKCHSDRAVVSSNYYGFLDKIASLSVGTNNLCFLSSNDLNNNFGSIQCSSASNPFFSDVLYKDNSQTFGQVIALNSSNNFNCAIRAYDVLEKEYNNLSSRSELICWGDGSYGKLASYDASDFDSTNILKNDDTINEYMAVKPSEFFQPDIQICKKELRIK